MVKNLLISRLGTITAIAARFCKPSRSLFFVVLLAGCANTMTLSQFGRAPANKPLPKAEVVMQTMQQVADWQLAHIDSLTYLKAGKEESLKPRGWVQSSFYLGLTELAERSKDTKYATWIGDKGKQWRWQLGENPALADDQLIAQTYLWYFHKQDPDLYYLDPTRRAFERVLKAHTETSLAFTQTPNSDGTYPCQTRWCWADALFMAPPSWFGMGQATGETKYIDFAHKEAQATIDYLLDPKHDLLARDSRFKSEKDQFGNPLFWSRSSGYVFAGLARMMDYIPQSDPKREYYEALFVRMATTLKTLQKRDGTWASSLLAKETMQTPETSGTALISYGFAWGVNQGLLEEQEYLPVVEKSWNALSKAVNKNGKLGWVQQIGASPSQVNASDSQVYAVGALLLAGAEIYDYQKAIIQ